MSIRFAASTGLALLACVQAVPDTALAAERPWSQRMADSEMVRAPDPLLLDSAEPKWDYTQGLVLQAILAVGDATGDPKYAQYVRRYYDGMIDAAGVIRTYTLEEFNIDRVNTGKALLTLYGRTGEARYRTALDTLREQLRRHPRTKDGGFWHKQRYPHQMWLDGLYMGATFLAQYARVFDDPAAFDDVATQFVLMEAHARDEETGLLYHGWDESREQRWADKTTGRSPSFWGRAVGWYAMALVDTLEQFPAQHPRRGELLAILRRLAGAVRRVQDPATGVWYQVLDQGSRQGNYLESSASAMLSYALLKGARLGYLGAEDAAAGRRAYEGIVTQFLTTDASGVVSISKVCRVAGLGGDPNGSRYRDGTFEYYLSEPIRSNDPKAVGPFILASLEMER
jgi:unsaturated rhamnogalacturonyl hydrolase